MGVIIFEVVSLVLVVGLLVFVGLDDRKNRKLREEEDRLKALEEAREKSSAAQSGE